MSKSIECYGKVNVGLNVYKVHPKKNNYHKIETIMILCREFVDTIIISESVDMFSVTYENVNGEVIDIKDDTITKAYKYFQKHFGLKKTYSVRVIKSIPIGSGFGGAASNAAYFMNHIAEINNFELTRTESNIFKESDYHKIVFEVGSDVPFFLSKSEIAHIEGFGEIINKIPSYNVPKFSIIATDITTSTTKIYEELDFLDLKLTESKFKKIISKLPVVPVKYVHNNLQNPAFSKHKKLKKWYDALEDEDKKSTFLNGSGGYFVKF